MQGFPEPRKSRRSESDELSEDMFPVQDQCITCHIDVEYMPEGLEVYDVHLQEGIGCSGCHGGDPVSDDEDIAMDPDAGFIGIPSISEIPEFCGRCHSSPSYMHDFQPMIRTDQVAQYSISVHGQKLVDGDEKVATCASCHTSHAILPASDTRSTVHAFDLPLTCRECHSDPIYMREYGLRTNQFREYASSVHGRALLEDHDVGAPACNDCHGNHGALPPEVSSVTNVCGTCHVNNMDFFQASPLAQVFEEQELHGCEACHGYHGVNEADVSMVGTDTEAVCMDCHDEGEPAYIAAGQIRADMDMLIAALDSASTMQDGVVRAGMDDLDIDYLLREGRQSLIQAQTTVHTFDPEQVAELTAEGTLKAREAMILSATQIKDHWGRRMGFALGSLFITILAVGLYLKIREIETKDKATVPRNSE